MTSAADNFDLLEQFKSFLEQDKTEPLALPSQTDLHTLLTEMVSLKTEVKAESRQFKNTLDTLSAALAAVQQDNQALSMALATHTEQLEQEKLALTRTLLLEIIDLHDRLAGGLQILQNYRPMTGLFKQSRARDVGFIERFKEGQVMLLKRFEQLLQRYEVRALAAAGKPFNPHTMTAVETGINPDLEDGMVIEELRKGFLVKDQVLRLAEVKVNKLR